MRLQRPVRPDQPPFQGLLMYSIHFPKLSFICGLRIGSQILGANGDSNLRCLFLKATRQLETSLAFRTDVRTEKLNDGRRRLPNYAPPVGIDKAPRRRPACSS